MFYKMIGVAIIGLVVTACSDNSAEGSKISISVPAQSAKQDTEGSAKVAISAGSVQVQAGNAAVNVQSNSQDKSFEQIQKSNSVNESISIKAQEQENSAAVKIDQGSVSVQVSPDKP